VDAGAESIFAPPPASGAVVGAFHLVELIGAGGMGQVYRAERVEGGFTQRVAVKVIGTPVTNRRAARRFRAERQILASLRHPHIVSLMDGANTLSPPAPGGYHPDSIPVQAALDDALAAGDRAALTRLPDGIIGRTAYQVLAGLIEPAPRSAEELYRGAPYGVGYFVGVWHP